jgi:hypothetical protein
MAEQMINVTIESDDYGVDLFWAIESSDYSIYLPGRGLDSLRAIRDAITEALENV